jgi:cephalosporin hydroxylase
VHLIESTIRIWLGLRGRTRLAQTAAGTNRPRFLEVDKWAVSDYLPKLVKVVGVRPYPLDELMLMAAAFEYHRPDVCIDIGTHLGKSARIWFELARRFKVPASIHTIDICDPAHPEYPGAKLGRYIRGLPIEQHVEDGYTCACRIIGLTPKARFLVFLDGDHSYDTVRQEMQLGRIMTGGCLLVHDTLYQPDSSYNHGPYLAIRDSLPDLAAKQVIHLQMGLPGMSYIGLE